MKTRNLKISLLLLAGTAVSFLRAFYENGQRKSTETFKYTRIR